MFAGAAREAVFANPEVAARVNAEFIPVALKAGMVNNPGRISGPESVLYAELNRTKAAPQGICVANADGKALAWALGFDDGASILDFLDKTKARFSDNPSGKPVTTQRYRRYPSVAIAPVADSGRVVEIPASHPAGDRCTGDLTPAEGTLAGRIVGRTVNADGKPSEQTVTQESYIEELFTLAPDVQLSLVRELRSAGAGDKFELPQSLSRTLVGSAYLGQLDVNPIGGASVGGKVDEEQWSLKAKVIGNEGDVTRLKITGLSDVTGSEGARRRGGDGLRWNHAVSLAWCGYLEVTGNQITKLDLAARGHEYLTWKGAGSSPANKPQDLRSLPAGRIIDLQSPVHYAIVAPLQKAAVDRE